jgi:hypothetical protein
VTYLDHYRPPVEGEQRWQLELSWREHTRARLDWLYGYDRARQIDAGLDPATQADIAAWNRLGKRSAA